MENGEDKITGWFKQQSKADSRRFPIGIGDDMAMVSLEQFAGEGFLVTTDMLLDGVHFELEKSGIEKAGYKAMAASLSDCAAMATIPVCAVVAVALPKGLDGENLKELHAGLDRAGEMFDCELIGGDITSWNGKFVISVTINSRVGNSPPVRRDAAKAGDVICVTGQLGGSLSGKHLDFIPRVNEALRLTEICKINSMMDLSDGLSRDLKRICQASGTGAEIDADKLPVSQAARESSDPIKSALNDGEDFELLFTLSEDEYGKLMKSWDMEVKISAIGRIIEGDKMWLIKDGGKFDLKPAGFDHLVQ